MIDDLKGKGVLVTGASTGIGAAVASLGEFVEADYSIAQELITSISLPARDALRMKPAAPAVRLRPGSQLFPATRSEPGQGSDE